MKNFRSLRDFSAELAPGLTLLVGPNNSGKSNVIDAIRTCFGWNVMEDSVRVQSDDWCWSCVRADGSREPIEISLEFGDLDETDREVFCEVLDVADPDPATWRVTLHTRAMWDNATERITVTRWAGSSAPDSGIPEGALNAISVTYLAALRDAGKALSPARRSRLGRYLRQVVEPDSESRAEIVGILSEANTRLGEHPALIGASAGIGESVASAIGTTAGDSVKLASSQPTFERIVDSMRLLVGDARELYSTGMGYSNILYIATVLAELSATKSAHMPLLLVEEPEAHLHPQLQIRLSEHLADRARGVGDDAAVQTIVSTHSPTIVSATNLDALIVLTADSERGTVAASLAAAGLSEPEKRAFERMLDVTRAQALFAHGILLVEGLSEALLVPVLARRLLGKSVAEMGFSVISVSGVSFMTIARVFSDQGIRVPVAVITDGDPARGDSGAEPSARVAGLRTACESNPRVAPFVSTVTLEWDLAFASPDNAAIMADVLAIQKPNSAARLKAEIAALVSAEEVANRVSSEIAKSSKGQFAQDLAEVLRDPEVLFELPEYLSAAIRYIESEGAVAPNW